jgi:hypothetical protein
MFNEKNFKSFKEEEHQISDFMKESFTEKDYQYSWSKFMSTQVKP